MTDHHDKLDLYVIFGGQSAERTVSYLTAGHVVAAVDQARYNVHAIGIAPDGGFVAATIPDQDLQADAVVPLAPVGPTISLVDQLANADRTSTVVLPLLHGPYGEDGTMQGLLEIADVAYVGAGVLGSATAMDKAMAKTVFDAVGIPQTVWVSVHRSHGTDAALAAKTKDAVGLPCFVKPANMGSSIGVSKATTLDELEQSLKSAFIYDELVVVEEAVTAREIEFAVLGNITLEVSIPGEIRPAANFYDFEDKYVDGAADLLIPAPLDETATKEMTEIAIHAYQALRVEGLARVDFLYEEEDRGPLVNEINTIPGFTPISMYPKLWEASGLGYSALIDRLVDLALERHQRRGATRGAQ